ncbi:pilus protein PilZ [Geomonas sp. Red276]
MSATPSEFEDYFQPGTRVRIWVPLADGRSFQEWGRVRSLDDDLVEVELSRDLLPQLVTLQPGRSAQVGIFDNPQGLGCRGNIDGWSPSQGLMLRLFGAMAPFEPREFFRQDVSLPIDYRIPPTQVVEEVMEHWRQSRWNLEFAAQEPELDESEEVAELRDEVRAQLKRRREAVETRANLSGGGIRFTMPEAIQLGTLVEIGVYLPNPGRMVETVGEAVNVKPVDGGFSTAFRFRFIEEADRDRVIGYLAALQLWQLSQLPPRGVVVKDEPLSRLAYWGRVALGLLVLGAFLGWQVRAAILAHERGEKHVIEKVFEQGIFDYLKQRH